MKDGTNVRGLNTAVMLWCSATIGAFEGCGLVGEAVVLPGFVLACNTLLPEMDAVVTALETCR